MSRWLWLIVVGVVGVYAGCTLFQAGPGDETTTVEEPADSARQQALDQVEALESMRNRSFPDDMEVAEGRTEGFGTEPVPESVREEWDWFERILFDGEETPLVIESVGGADRAGFDADRRRLAVSGDPRTDDETAFAVAMVAGRALEQMEFAALPEVETVDEWITRAVVRRAGPAFGASMLLAEQFGVDLTADRLAERPDLAAHIPGIGNRLDEIEEPAEMTAEQLEPAEGTEFFEEALRHFVLRQAVSTGAALYRAGGWPAVEWGRTEPPTRSEEIVRPRRWFEGEGPAEWAWPEDFVQQREEANWELVRDGRVGPAVTSLWLEGLVGARAARTIYSGWMDDTYRIYRRGEDEETAFHWVSAWETPHDAQEVASAMEAALGHYVGHEHREQRFRVATRGVNVAVSIYEQNQDVDRVAREVELLTTTGPGFLPGDEAPFDYEAPLYERYVQKTEEATLDADEDRWIDPASGWKTDLASLDGWTVQRSNEAHVRWFANHSDGTLVQWTTELIDPFDPDFGSEAYVEELEQRFADSMETDESPEVEVVDGPTDETLQLEVVGRIEDRPQVLRLWQWRRGDVLVSFSIQGPEGFFGERIDEAKAVISNLEKYGEPVEERRRQPATDPKEDEGIIEFQVGEEATGDEEASGDQ